MTDGDLAGCAIVVVEDSYCQAQDAVAVLQDAGARVIGPFREAGHAMAAADSEAVDGALLDIDLGEGPQFGLPRFFLARGTPVVLYTGYDDLVIPSDLSHVPCVQKPVMAARLVAVVCKALGRA